MSRVLHLNERRVAGKGMSMADTDETIEEIEEAPEEEVAEAGVGRRKFFGPTLIRTLIYVAIALVLIIISGTIAYIVAKRVGTAPATEKISPEYRVREKPLMYYDLESFSINTSDTEEPHFIKITISIGYDQGNVELQTELNARKPQLRDIVISIVGEKRYADLNTQPKREALKEEIKLKINSVLTTPRAQVKEIVFTEFVLT